MVIISEEKVVQYISYTIPYRCMICLKNEMGCKHKNMTHIHLFHDVVKKWCVS